MGKAENENKRVGRTWVHLHPPNHAGYYYCHLCGGWVHESEAELEHLTPKSVEKIDMSKPGWDDKLRMAHIFPVRNMAGKIVCIGNREKGSRQDIPSVTMEIAPPDEAC